MEALIHYINQYTPLSDVAREALQKLVTVERVKKNHYFLKQDQYCNKICFIEKGMVRKFHYVDGKEKTTWIHTENDTFTSLQSYGQQIPSQEFLQACEDTIAISITRENSYKLIEFPEIALFTNAMMQNEFVNIDKHTRELNSRDARGKYEYLRTIAPELIKRAKQTHIASILGVTPETLSRVRKG